MTKRTERTSATVPQAQQAEDTALQAALCDRWRWVEPCVWTVRMLTALEQGVKGEKWSRLFDKVFAEKNLMAALQQVARNDGAAGVDHVTVTDFARRLPDSLWELADQLKAGTFVPQSVRRKHIQKPGTNETRPLGIPTVRDRVAQAAIVHVIEPIFERDFAEHSYGFRPGRSAKDALRQVDKLLKTGHFYVVDADLKSYFDTIPHARLMSRLKEKIADGSVLSLIESFLKAAILDEISEWVPTQGAPQGAVLSPLLSNIYLNPLDHELARSGFEMVRYADDFVILCRTAEDAARALQAVERWVSENGLTLHPTKTRIVDSRTEQFDFLGYSFQGQDHWPRDKSLKKLKDSIREKTPRTSGHSLEFTVRKVSQTLRGWFAYFRHSTHYQVYPRLDSWIRMRLRSMLRKRMGLRGHGRGQDHHRWPNRFFAEHGLYSLVSAHASVVQSSCR